MSLLTQVIAGKVGSGDFPKSVVVKTIKVITLDE